MSESDAPHVSKAAKAKMDRLIAEAKDCPHTVEELKGIKDGLSDSGVMKAELDGLDALGKYHEKNKEYNLKLEQDYTQRLSTLEAKEKLDRKRDAPSDNAPSDSRASAESAATESRPAKAPRMSAMADFLATYQTPASAPMACLAASPASTTAPVSSPAPASTTTPQYALMNGAINGTFAPPEAPSDNEVFKKNLGTSLIKFRPYHHPKPGEHTRAGQG